ncbi:MAG TPA: hypothetical protein DCE23_02740 [Firmicutes bacterium]|nr:hypothetical protein [Bacillota bacterium]
MNNKLINLNDCTLIEKNANVIDIYFYPAHSITKTKVTKLEKEICIRFFIERRPDDLCDMHCSLITDYDKEIYNSYNMLSKEIDNNKFAFVREVDSSENAEVLPKGVIDFNILDYDYFISVLKENKDLKKLVPYLAEHLRKNIATLQSVQETIEHLNIMGPSSFYQNTIAYFVDRIEELSSTEDKDLKTRILENIKKNFDLVFIKDQLQIDLTYINLLAIIINKIKSDFIKPISYLEKKELQCDLLKESMSIEELNDVLENIEQDYAEDSHKEISSVNERVKFFLKTKPYIKEFKSFIRIIIASSSYLSDEKVDGLVDEEKLKEAIVNSLVNFNYRSLERNLVLLYNKEENKCDFLCIASIDCIFSLLQTYRLNSQIENQVYVKDYKILLNLYRNNNQTTPEEKMRIYIIIILMLNVYYYKNLGSLTLFNKGEFILKLEFKKGEYDIQAINRNTEEVIGRLLKISDPIKDKIKAALDKNEKTFNELINSIFLENIAENISLGTIKTDINSLSHKDIVIYLTKNRKKDIFDLTVTLDELLLLLTEFKPASDNKKVVKKAKKKDKDDVVIIENDRDKDKAFVLRKADTIYNIMEINEIDSDEYKKIASLYKSYLKEDDTNKKTSIYKELAKIILR